MDRVNFDGVLVIGAGLAGFTAALAAAPRRVRVLSACALGEGSASAWAQGGVAAALHADDHPDLHAADTLAAGAGLCDAEAVRILTQEGPEAVRWLAGLGAPFDRHADGGFSQSLEAAHSRPRVARVGGDGAGRAIMDAVMQTARDASHIEIHEHVRARALIQDAGGRVRGAVVETRIGLCEIIAPITLLATGGLGGLYAVTTDPAAVRGDGLAMAALAGARIDDAEFVQFHPTAIDIGADPAPLATEALRGEGARLINRDGATFMVRYHPSGDLAPRDVVARAIALERRAGRGAFLDAREAVGDGFPAHFPFVFNACRGAGLDPRHDPIPVLPAAHYHMGGIATDLRGAASLAGLYAAGECAAVGVHGANRLASNSLLEAAVFGRRAGLAARDASGGWSRPDRAPLPADLPADVLAALRQRMADDAGVARDAKGLSGLIAWLDRTESEHGRALALVTARLVAEAALERRESLGAHCRMDHPDASSVPTHSRRTLGPTPAYRQQAA